MAKITVKLGFIVLQSILLIVTVDAQSGNDGRQFAEECTTPNGLSGFCLAIRGCQPLLNILTERPLVQERIEFLRRSQCGFAPNNDPKVCCPRANNNNNGGVPNDTGNPTVSPRNNPNLPTDCGRDLSSRIVGGEITELDEFPWMVLLEYSKPNGKTTACGGVLVSERYVLTAAHCISGKDLPKTWNLNTVRLGEYDTTTERDCIQDGENSQICADEPVTIRIEEKIVHESYRPTTRDQRNDVALIRLAQNVQFTNYIKPICLPSSVNMAERLWVAGWGKTENTSASSVKLKLGISPSDRPACLQKYRGVGVNLGDSQLCAGGQRGKDSCRGDSGGPLMSFERNPDGTAKWTVVGIVSFGPTPCGMQGWPGIYTRIVDYLPWILSKIRA